MSAAFQSAVIPAPVVPVPPSLSRNGRREEEHADADEAILQTAKDRLRDYRALVERTVDVFGSEIKASLWLSTPSPDFGGKAPIQAAEEVEFSPGAIEDIFEPVFVRIEEGIYW
jgi:uncharacterized protein (DUF2384 family)